MPKFDLVIHYCLLDFYKNVLMQFERSFSCALLIGSVEVTRNNKGIKEMI